MTDIRQMLVKEGYIPLDKSWHIRMGVLDLINGYNDCKKFLSDHEGILSDDLQALQNAMVDWNSEFPVYVGESGTLYRFLRYASLKLGKHKEFTKTGTLLTRKIYSKDDVVDMPLEELLKLDHGTSQWGSAAVLTGNTEKLVHPPHGVQVTYRAIDHWNMSRWLGHSWITHEPHYDGTILEQAAAYINWLKTGKMIFKPMQAEDYCFARAFGLMTPEKGKRRWPSLEGHETNRIIEMEDTRNRVEIISRDHRIIQAEVMRRKNDVQVRNPHCVNKSWPQFWKFMEDSEKLIKSS
jgi:hypothetical protein